MFLLRVDLLLPPFCGHYPLFVYMKKSERFCCLSVCRVSMEMPFEDGCIFFFQLKNFIKSPTDVMSQITVCQVLTCFSTCQKAKPNCRKGQEMRHHYKKLQSDKGKVNTWETGDCGRMCVYAS